MFRVRVDECEAGLLFRDGRFVALLGPGTYRVWRPWRTRIEVVNRLEPRFVHHKLDMLLQHDALNASLYVLHVRPRERVLVWQADRLVAVLGPGRHALWREPLALTFESHDICKGRLEHPRLLDVARHADACTLFDVVNVGTHECVEVSQDGQQTEVLGPGVYVFWQGTDLRWRCVNVQSFTTDARR